MPDSRIPPIAIALLLIACLCIYGIILDPRVTFAGMDFINLNYPRAALTRNAFLNGVIPLWNWYEWGGAPLVAALQGAVFYPPTWLALALPLPYGLQAFVFGHLFAAGCGAYVVSRRIWKMSPASGLLCGVIYMGSGFFPGRIEQFQIIAVNCLLPWLLVAVWNTWRQQKLGGMLPGIWAMTLLAGHPQYAVFNILAALGFTGLAHLGLPRTLRWKAFNSIVTGLVLGSGIAALQLLPTWELGRFSERIWPYPEPTLPELSWWHLPAIIIPKYYNFLTGETGRIFGYTELGLYAGVLAVPLLVGSLVLFRSQGKRTKRLIIAASVLWLFALVFALGRSGLVAPLIFEHVPFFTQTRGAARTLNIAALMLALLAAQGLAMVIGKLPSLSRRKQFGLAAGLAALTCADITFQHWSSLRAVLVDKYALTAKPLESEILSATGRLYRFMANDSDLYLNNSPAAVAERHVRLQPNLSSLFKYRLIDGYEEGLLPVRTYANLQRRFNRNLRSDSPDPALLAFLGSTTMLTEFPLPSSGAWKPISPVYQRPPIVPQVIANQPAKYQYWKSGYNPALLLDLSKLTAEIETDKFLKECNVTFPIEETVRAETRQQLEKHPLQSLEASAFNEAAAAFRPDETVLSWNRLYARSTGETTTALVLLRPYPGWQLEKTSLHNSLKTLCSLFYSVEVSPDYGTLSRVSLVFAPFSFRLGLFISLFSLLVYTHFLISRASRYNRG